MFICYVLGAKGTCDSIPAPISSNSGMNVS